MPIVVLPGGPGVASALMYERFRRRAAADGLDVLMVEHRGVGLSRRSLTGEDLPLSAITVADAVDDVAAVLDAEGIERAVLAGASYGTYLVQGVGVRHPDRVAGMVLDSTMLGTRDHLVVREHARRLLWHGDAGAGGDTRRIARKVRTLVERDGHAPEPLGSAVRILFEFSTDALLERFLDQVVVDRAGGTLARLAALGSREVTEDIPFLMEFSLAGQIAFRELRYAPEPDGMIFDPAPGMAEAAKRFAAFETEPFDLVSALPGFDWPVAVVSGDRDLRTPRPAAEHATGLLPDGVLLPLPATGHSALDTHPAVFRAVAAAVRDHAHRELPARASELASLPREGGPGAWIPRLARASLLADRARTALRGRPIPDH